MTFLAIMLTFLETDRIDPALYLKVSDWANLVITQVIAQRGSSERYPPPMPHNMHKQTNQNNFK